MVSVCLRLRHAGDLGSLLVLRSMGVLGVFIASAFMIDVKSCFVGADCTGVAAVDGGELQSNQINQIESDQSDRSNKSIESNQSDQIESI